MKKVMDLPNRTDDINPMAKQIFKSIFEDAMKDFRSPLEFLTENKFGMVWRDESELHEKVMTYSKQFVSDVTEKFCSKHSEITKQIEGSACDEFERFFTEKLQECAFAKHDFYEHSFQETKKEFSRKISRMKEHLEKEEQKVPKVTSDIEEMISQTELFDPVHIQHALLCCRVAYECKDPDHPEKSLEDLGERHLLGELMVSYENEHVPRYVMARCGDVLYVAFSGISVLKCALPAEADWRGYICSSGLEQAKKIPLGYFAREIIQERRIIFSGHSTGGITASLVAVLLLEKLKHLPKDYLESNLKCITFGIAPFGNSMFKNYAESMPTCFCHIVKKDDIIPKLFGINSNKIQKLLIDMVNQLVQMPFNALSENSPRWTVLNESWNFFVRISTQNYVVNRETVFDIFGKYYILDTSIRELTQRCRVVSAAQASIILNLRLQNILELRSVHLVNHRIERYQHDVSVCLVRELPEFQKFPHCSVEKFEDITPKIGKVQFENIGNRVVAKVTGRSMWFVYEVSIGEDKHLRVEYMKSTESEVQTEMPKSHVSHNEHVTVRAKTHFNNSKYMPAEKVQTATTNYKVSRRQEQLSKHSPCSVIELAYLSALLERRGNEKQSKRFNAIKTFLGNVVSVVPIESVFHAMATARLHTVLQCCQLFLSAQNIFPSPTEPSMLLLDEMPRAIRHILGHFIDEDREEHWSSMIDNILYEEDWEEHCMPRRQSHLSHGSMRYQATNRTVADQLFLDEAVSKMKMFLNEANKNLKSVRAKSLCGLNLETIYPSSDVDDGNNVTPRCCKAPVTLLMNGKKELNRFSEEMGAELDTNVEEGAVSNSNIEMLKVLNKLRTDFETCSTLLGAFMEAQVQIPLEGKTYVNTIAKHVKSFGLDLWGLLILPFSYIQNMLGRVSLPGKCQRLVIDIASSMYDRLTLTKRHITNYDGKLEFLLASTKKSFTSNKEFVSYSLERQLVEECENRHIFAETSLEEILLQWQANFEDETLTLVPDYYRPLIARWIKWSLMINRLRESIAEQTAVGIIGLVNSGKSKFVRSIFEIQTITGTTAARRTTVPFIYNLEPEIKGMDVIDFPGVDDQDKTIPELAKLLLSLTRIVVFIVEYKRVHTQATMDWLNVLEKENVPVLICLSFADKLYAELMGEGGNRDVEEIKKEIQTQLTDIKKQIGQPEIGRRDFKFTVFSFDNDSKLDCDEGKDKLRQAGLNDELDVGRWIAEKLLDINQSDLSQRVFNFIKKKEKSTLNSNKTTRKRGQPTKKTADTGDVPTKRKDAKVDLGLEQPTCSKYR